MNTEILGVILQWVCLVVLCYPLGRHIAKVYKGEKNIMDFMAPVERFIYKSAASTGTRDELEAVPESAVDREPVLVHMG